MSPEPADRFKSVLDFVAVLSGDDFGTTSALPAAERPSRASSVVTIPTTRRRIPWNFLGGAAVVVALGVAITIGLRQPKVVGILPQAGETTPTAQLRRPTFDDPAPPPVSAPASAAGQDRPGSARPTPPPIPRPPVPATLFVNARPWGVLFVDGQRVGNTPRANLAIAPGSHLIRIERDGFVPFERTVQLAPGAELRLTDIVLEPIAPR